MLLKVTHSTNARIIPNGAVVYSSAKVPMTDLCSATCGHYLALGYEPNLKSPSLQNGHLENAQACAFFTSARPDQ